MFRSPLIAVPAAFLLLSLTTEPLASRPSTAAQAPQAAPRGEWVARQIEDRDTGKDGRFDIRMRLFDRQGRARERALSMLTLRAQSRAAKPSVKGSPQIGDRLLIRFTYPNDIKGTAFLVWEHPGEDDERFLYLPALGRVRRIAGQESQESFVGSDFTYEDIGGRELDDYTYTLLDENATWLAPEGKDRKDGKDGKSHPAYRLESRTRSSLAVYPRVVSLVRKDSFVVVHADIYNKRNELEKVYDVRRLEPIETIWTAMDVVMVNTRDSTRTEMSILKADYNVGVTESDFSRRELERGVS